jgi:hypothetical protein
MRSALIVALLASLASPFALADSNVALGGTVTTVGSGFGNNGGWCCSAPAPLSSLTDGIFLATGQQWNVNTVFWGAPLPDTSDVITITLSQAAEVNSVKIQSDNNDYLAIQYRDIGGSWFDLVTLKPADGWGLDNAFASFATVTATAFSIHAVAGGDGLNAVSEFQAYGNTIAVPEPESLALMLAGLAVVGASARRRKSA